VPFERSRGRRVMDGLLLLIEITAVVGFISSCLTG